MLAVAQLVLLATVAGHRNAALYHLALALGLGAGELVGLRWTDLGTPISARNLLRQFKGLLKQAGLPDDVWFHDLRHTAGSLMLDRGAQLVTVSKILGHSSPMVTATIYAHAFQESQARD